MALPFKTKRDDASFLLIVLGCIWGSSFILIKRILPCFNPIQFALLRIIFTGLCFTPWFLSSYKKINRKQFSWLLLLGLMGYFFAYSLMGLSQTHISSSLAGILASLNPLATFVIGIAFFRQSFRWKNFWGIAMGLLGSLVLILFDRAHGETSVGFYSLFMIGSVIFSSITINITQNHLSGLSPYVIASVSFVGMALPALVLFTTTADWTSLSAHPQILTCLMSAATLAMVGTVIGSLLYYHIISKAGALYTSTVTYIIPVVAILWGLIDGELVHWNNLVGLGLIIGGIKLIRST